MNYTLLVFDSRKLQAVLTWNNVSVTSIAVNCTLEHANFHTAILILHYTQLETCPPIQHALSQDIHPTAVVELLNPICTIYNLISACYSVCVAASYVHQQPSGIIIFDQRPLEYKFDNSISAASAFLGLLDVSPRAPPSGCRITSGQKWRKNVTSGVLSPTLHNWPPRLLWECVCAVHPAAH